MPDLRVAVVGPESSGKTTLVDELRVWLQQRSIPVVVVAEQGRLLAEALPPGHPWSFREQRATSLSHQGAEAVAQVTLRAQHGSGVVLCDGTAATPAVWHLCAMRRRPGYEAGPPEVTEQLLAAAAQPYDVVLLLAPDLPWEADGVRDDPHGRQEAFEEYARLYPEAVIVRGHDRREQALAVLERELTGA